MTVTLVEKETTVFDIKAIEKSAKDEIAKEAADKARGRIKEHLRRLAQAKTVVANLEREYEVLLSEIGADAA